MPKAMTRKQIKFFGTKAQRAGLKRKVSNSRRKVRKNSPGNRAIAGYGSTTMNPPGGGGRVITGYGSTVMNGRRKRKRNASAGDKRVVIVNPRRRRAKNPGGASLFGSSLTSKNGLMIIGGGFTGLIVAKTLPSILPSSSIGSSATGRFVLALAAGWAGAWAGRKFVSSSFGDGVLFGGMIQAGSIALDAFLPSVYSSLGIGLGELMPGKFPVPQNPIRAALAARAIAAPVAPGSTPRVAMSGLTRAFGNAF
jgi:hypothetical protein